MCWYQLNHVIVFDLWIVFDCCPNFVICTDDFVRDHYLIRSWILLFLVMAGRKNRMSLSKSCYLNGLKTSTAYLLSLPMAAQGHWSPTTNWTLYYSSSVTDPIIAESNLLPIQVGASVHYGNKNFILLLLLQLLYSLALFQFAAGILVQDKWSCTILLLWSFLFVHWLF